MAHRSHPHHPTQPIPELLAGQVALVTGANSGIGEGIALALATAGADIALNYVVHPEEAQRVGSAIEAMGRKVVLCQADVSSEKDVLAMFSQVVEALGRIDILVNNAGIQRDAPFAEMTLEQWNQVLGINLTGQFLCARESVKQFLKQGVDTSISCAAGKIICISSVHEVIPWAGHANYAASKGGIMLMMKSLSQEVAPHHIRVNSLCPGAIRTPINRSAWETPEAYHELLTLIPYGRIGDVDDLGRAAVWLASDQSDYVNGTSLFVDGGMTLYPGFTTNG